ncbi:MAG: HAMP domain-containing sensor histidine kinase, partial [Patescibacteria group bacterium]
KSSYNRVMDNKSPSSPETLSAKVHRYERIIELSTWAIIIVVIFGVRFLPVKLVENQQAYLLIGGIVAFALLYYLVIYKYFSRSKRLYFKDIADIVLIGVLIHVVKDYSQYFFALYFLPIAAAALSLEFINALLIATVASVFVIFEVFLGSQDLLPHTASLYQGASQIAMILFVTIFCRVLAMQLRQEKAARESLMAREKIMEEEAKKQKEFLSLTSHQLFTPLSMIRGFASLLHFGNLGDLTTKQRDAVGEIYANTKRMIDLVSELLSVSRIQAGTFSLKLKETYIDQLIKNIIDQFKQGMPKKDIKIVLEKKTSLKPVQLDADKMRSCLYNLVDNALKYTPQGTIKITCQQRDDQTIIEVIDQGIGIKEESFEKLFQPFFRGKNILELDKRGTGLGLYISKLIVEKHNGKIWAKNNPDKGATFALSIPMI